MFYRPRRKLHVPEYVLDVPGPVPDLSTNVVASPYHREFGPRPLFIQKWGQVKCCCTTVDDGWGETCEVFLVPLPDVITVNISGMVDGLCDCDPFNDTFEIDVQGDYTGVDYCLRSFRLNTLPWDITVNFYCSHETETRAILVSAKHNNGGMCYPNCMAYGYVPLVYLSHGGLASLTPDPTEWDSATGPFPSASGTETYTATKIAGGCGCGVSGSATISWGA